MKIIKKIKKLFTHNCEKHTEFYQKWHKGEPYEYSICLWCGKEKCLGPTYTYYDDGSIKTIQYNFVIK